MKPKILEQEIWNKLKMRYKMLDLNTWNVIDGVRKVEILEEIGINIPEPTFGNDYIINYPEHIYKFRKCKKYNLNVEEMREFAINEEKEVGGIIENNKIKILFIGSNDRINLDLEESMPNMKSIILFHTHPKDDNVQYDPPSILDIISFLSFNIKSIADLILNRGNVDVRNALKIQLGIVFTKNEIYTYYLSHQLVMNIVNSLLTLYPLPDFIENVEKMLEEIELYYTATLQRFNKTLQYEEVEEYLLNLESLGFLLHRTSYYHGLEFFAF